MILLGAFLIVLGLLIAAQSKNWNQFVIGATAAFVGTCLVVGPP